MTLIRADLHTHTSFSTDATTSPDEYVRRCLRAGITCVAVTDHDGIDGALHLREIAPFKVIVAEEIRTDSGEIIGLFLNEPVPRGLSPEETIALVKGQGGLVCTPHPFDRFRQGVGPSVLARILAGVDAVEVFNARIRLPRDNDRARRFAVEHALPMTAGTDAHTPGELGRSYVEMPDFDTPQQFLESLRLGTIVGKRAPRYVYAFSTMEKLRRRLGMSRDRTSARGRAARR